MFLPNIDTLIFTCNITNYNSVIKKYLPELEMKQNLAKATAKNQMVEIGNMTFELLPNGARAYRFILHNNFFEIKLQQGWNPNSSNFPIYVKLKSEFLWSRSTMAYFETIEFLNAALGAVTETKISRIDMACHTDKINMDRLKLDQFVTRSTSRELYYNGRHLSGVVFGKSPIKCRIYDKSLEIEQSSKKTWFYDIWKKNGSSNEGIVNVEFQLNREFFKSYGIETFEEFLNVQSTIWRYLTEKWLRYVYDNHSRIENCDTAREWSMLQESYDIWNSFDGIERQKQKKASEHHLLHLISCYMVNHASVKGINDINQYMYETIGSILNHYDIKKINFDKVVTEKMMMG